MNIVKSSSGFYFNGFEIHPIETKNHIVDELISPTSNTSLLAQLNIFRELESNFSIFDGNSFGKQVHFQNAFQVPVQRWFPYREGFSIDLVNSFLRELKITGNVFDPFVGSGTTLLASRTNNLNSFGMDVNPISTLVASVENEKCEKETINDIKQELENILKIKKSSTLYRTEFSLAEKVFNHEILQALLQLKEYIFKIKNEETRNIIFVGWLSIIEDVSNIKKEGNGIKYKNRKRTSNGYIEINKELWESQYFPDGKFDFVRNSLINKLNVIFNDLKQNYGNCAKKPRIFLGNCLEFDNYFSDEIEFTFFSPPYCNCFDYFEIHKVELWLGDFVKNKMEFKYLRNTGFRSNTNSLNDKPIVYKNENLEKLIELFDLDRLWSKKIPDVVRGYFDDMNSLLLKLFNNTRSGGYVGIVVGNSAYSGVILPTDIIIAEIAKQIGFSINNIFITRHLTTSSQQKKELEFLKSYLRESIILLRK